MRFLAPALLVALAPAAAAQEAAPDLVFTGTITGADHQHYKPVPFDMPKGVERVTVTLNYDRSNKTVVDLGVWDPQRFRGWSGGTRDRFTIAASEATPGYLAGELPAGRWRVMLGVPNARAGSTAAYRVTIRFDRGANHAATNALAETINPAPGWYRGDLHMHDAHSDGSCASQSGRRVPCPLFRTVEKAAAAGLDFIAVTDHNTVSHFSVLRELQPWFDKLLLIPGAEITTFGGHANLVGQRGFVDFRVGSREVPDVRALERAAAASGGILSINHPALPSGEACMGCGWTWPDTDWRGITAIEAVNGALAEGPLAGIGFWYARLNEGHRLTGIAGSDNHNPDATPGQSPIGRPTTVVYAEQLSTEAILQGIRNGNVFIDVTGKGGLLEVTAEAGGRSAAMGGTLQSSPGLLVHVHATRAADTTAELVVNASAAQRQRIHSPDATIQFRLDARSCGWVAINIRDDAGRLLLVGNPIYLACRQPS